MSLRSKGFATCLCLSLIVSNCLSLSLLMPWSCCMFLAVSYGCLLSLNVCLCAKELMHFSYCLLLLLSVFLSLLVPWRCCTACITLSYCCWLSLIVFLVPCSCYMSLTVSSISMDLLHVSHCLPLLLAVSASAIEFVAVSNCPSGPMELLNVSHCLSLLMAVSHCLY